MWCKWFVANILWLFSGQVDGDLLYYCKTQKISKVNLILEITVLPPLRKSHFWNFFCLESAPSFLSMCYGLDMVCPCQNSYWNLIASATVLRDSRPFRDVWGVESSTFMKKFAYFPPESWQQVVSKPSSSFVPSSPPHTPSCLSVWPFWKLSSCWHHPLGLPSLQDCEPK